MIPCVCTNCRIWEAEASACPCTWPVWAVPWAAPRRGQGQQLHGCPLPQNGLAVFDPQNVVGRLQQIRSTGAQCFGGCGTGDGKGQAAFQLAAQRRRERRTAQRGSRCLQRGRAPGFRHRTQGYRTPARPADVPRQRQIVLRWRWHRAQAAPPPGPPRQPALRAPAQLPAGWVPHRAAQRRCSCTPRWYWPPRCRSMRSCNAWPLWNGSYSAMMPTKFISSTPDSLQILFAYAEKSLAMFSASLYNKFV